jgi:hypothetical protein
MVWFLLLFVYKAPADPVDWNGPWTYGMSRMMDDPFPSEAACQSAAAKIIARLHEGMLAPMRYRCVGVPDGLPKGAPR